MNKNFGFAFLPAIAVIVILAGLGVSGYMLYQKNQPNYQYQPSPSQPIPAVQNQSRRVPDEKLVSTNETANWKTHMNDDYNFTYKYPSNLTLRKYKTMEEGYAGEAPNPCPVNKRKENFSGVEDLNRVPLQRVLYVLSEEKDFSGREECFENYANHSKELSLGLLDYVSLIHQKEKDNSNQKYTQINDIQNVVVDGVNGYGFQISTSFDHPKIFIFLERKNVRVQIIYQSDRPDAEKILSTFKFTN